MSDEDWDDEKAVMKMDEYLKDVGSVEIPNATFAAVHSQIVEIVEWMERIYDVDALVDVMNGCTEVWSTAIIRHTVTKQGAIRVFQDLMSVVDCLLDTDELRNNSCVLYLKAVLQYVLDQLQARTANHNWFQFVNSRLETYE